MRSAAPARGGAPPFACHRHGLKQFPAIIETVPVGPPITTLRAVWTAGAWPRWRDRRPALAAVPADSETSEPVGAYVGLPITTFGAAWTAGASSWLGGRIRVEARASTLGLFKASSWAGRIRVRVVTEPLPRRPPTRPGGPGLCGLSTAVVLWTRKKATGRCRPKRAFHGLCSSKRVFWR